MKNKQSFLFFVLFVLFSAPLFAEKSLIIGVFRHASTADKADVLVQHYYIDGKSDTYTAKMDENGQFALEVDIPEPQYITLSLRGQHLVFYLEPNDTLAIETDLFSFPISVAFSGKSGENNTLLRRFLEKFPINFDEFTKAQYKIGGHWSTIEQEEDEIMRVTPPEDYKLRADRKKLAQFGFLDEYLLEKQGRVSQQFIDFLSAEILYGYAYRLLFYGNIYKNMHDIDPVFFEALYDVPPQCDAIGNPTYRRYLMLYMAYRGIEGGLENSFRSQYLLASDLLSDKSLAFFRSEIIFNALKNERVREAMEYYDSFLQNNKLDGYELKVADLYEKATKVSPGTPAPSFLIKDEQGTVLTLAQMEGKVVYLNFWASYCGSCITKIGYFNQAMTELESEGISVVNVSIDRNPELWRNAMLVHQVKGRNVLSRDDSGTDLAKLFQVEAVPHFFIIGKTGAFESKPASLKAEDIKARLLELAKK